VTDEQQRAAALIEIQELVDHLAAEQMLSSRKIQETRQLLDQLVDDAENRWEQIQQLRRELQEIK